MIVYVLCPHVFSLFVPVLVMNLAVYVLICGTDLAVYVFICAWAIPAMFALVVNLICNCRHLFEPTAAAVAGQSAGGLPPLQYGLCSCSLLSCSRTS
jgi:hypothetical protein